MEENQSEFRSFESLNVWQQAREIRNEVFQLCKSFPKEETYKLTDQMVRSSRSIGNNIAEGYGRYHYQENIQFCRQSRGSSYELIDHLITALDCEYIQDKTYSDLQESIIDCIKLTNGYIAYLHRQKSNIIKEDPTSYNPD
jgi:four helix bundle protein